MKAGYFSSNRSGGSIDGDIYSMDILKDLEIGKKIKGIAKGVDENPISQTFVSLFDEKDSVISTFTTKEDGSYAFLVDANKGFKLIGKKENYLDAYNSVNTFGKEYIVTADLMLLQKPDSVVPMLVVQATPTPVNSDLGKTAELKSIYFDLDKYNIRPDAALELTKIVKIINENPNMTVKLSSYTDCRATAAYNQILSNKRANASAQYIKARITNPSRISSKGYGETNLVNGCACEGVVVSNCSNDDFQKSRRTEFNIMSNDKTIQSVRLVSIR